MVGEKSETLGLNGYVPIVELYEAKPHAGAKHQLRSYNTTTKKWAKAQLVSVKKVYAESLYRVSLENGYSMVVSGQQPFLTDKGDVTLEDLKITPKHRAMRAYRKGTWNFAIRTTKGLTYSPLYKVAPVVPQYTYELRMCKTHYSYVVDKFVLVNMRGQYGQRKKDKGSRVLEGISQEATKGSERTSETTSETRPEKPDTGTNT